MPLGDNLPRGVDRVYVLETEAPNAEGAPVWGATGTLAGGRFWMATGFLSAEMAEGVKDSESAARGNRWPYRVAEYRRVGVVSETQDEALELAHSLAEEAAASLLVSECLTRRDAADVVWCDTSTAPCDLDEALRYLELRGLLERHPERSDWVHVRHEAAPPVNAPLAEVTK